MRRREVVFSLAAAALPSSASAQSEKPLYRVGYLALARGEDTQYLRDFVRRLEELGLVEGRNMTLLYRSAEGDAQRLPGLAADLVRQAPDVIVTGFGTLAAQAAKAATTSIPVVFATVGDPVRAGLVSSLGRPGGNVTGLSSQGSDLGGKRLQLLLELVPGAKRIAILGNPESPFMTISLGSIRTASQAAAVTIDIREVRSIGQMAAQLNAAATAGAAGLMVLGDPVVDSFKRELIDLVAARRLPAIYGQRTFPAAGGLASYGTNIAHNFRKAADYVHKIINGTKPGDLAVEQPTSFEFVLNLKTAKALGLTVSPLVLAQADEVIE